MCSWVCGRVCSCRSWLCSLTFSEPVYCIMHNLSLSCRAGLHGGPRNPRWTLPGPHLFLFDEHVYSPADLPVRPLPRSFTFSLARSPNGLAPSTLVVHFFPHRPKSSKRGAQSVASWQLITSLVGERGSLPPGERLSLLWLSAHLQFPHG